MTLANTVTDHLAQPGPLYWGWRCLRCDQPVRDHAGIAAHIGSSLRRLFRRSQGQR